MSGAGHVAATSAGPFGTQMMLSGGPQANGTSWPQSVAGPSSAGPSHVAAGAVGGVGPTPYFDELRRYLQHLSNGQQVLCGPGPGHTVAPGSLNNFNIKI